MNSVSQIMITRVGLISHGLPHCQHKHPYDVSSSCTWDKPIFSGILSAVARRSPLTAVVLAAAVVLPDDLGLSSFHSEGVSRMRATTSLNASVTQMWALIESIPKW